MKENYNKAKVVDGINIFLNKQRGGQPDGKLSQSASNNSSCMKIRSQDWASLETIFLPEELEIKSMQWQ